MTRMCDRGVIIIVKWNYMLVTPRGERVNWSETLTSLLPILAAFSNYYTRPFQVSCTLHLFCDLSNSRWLHPVKEVVQVTCSFLLHFKADISMAWAILYFIVENILLNLHWLFSLFCTVNLFLKVRSPGVYVIWNLQRNFLTV